MNIVMALEMAAECHPDRIAVTSDSATLSYAQLLHAARSAGRLIRESGAKYTALLDINSLAAPIAIYASAYAGIPYVPMNYRLTKSEIEELLGRVTPAFLISSTQSLEKLALPDGIQVMMRDEFVQKALNGDGQAPESTADASAIAIQLFTSGTTGAPKAAVLRHENLMSYILGSVEFASAEDSSAALVSVPPYHIAGISAVLSSTYACRRMVQLPNFDAASWLQLCRDENVTNAFMVPTMLSRIADYLEESGAVADLPAMRAIAYGGGKMPLQVISKIMETWPGVDFTNAYGLTETSSTISLLNPEDHRSGFNSTDPEVSARLASVGKPLPSVEIKICGDDGKPVGTGELGDIYVRGGQVSGEYLGVGSLLDEQGWFPTRDRGYLDSYGYLYLDGRADDVIVRGGENISPGEIEDVLREHAAVADVAVVGIHDEQWGETVAAAIVLHDKATVAPEELQEWVKLRLRSSRVPSAIAFKKELPYNEMGKILRRVLKNDFA